jgi:IS4 transposase
MNEERFDKINLLVSILPMVTLGSIISRRLYIYWRYRELKNFSKKSKKNNHNINK